MDHFNQIDKTYLITVNYKSSDSITSLMTSIAGLNNKLSQVKLIIIDSSNDFSIPDDSGNLEFELEVIKLPKNMGFAHACNIGIRMAQRYANFEKIKSFIWLINPDTRLHPESLNELKRNSQKDLLLGSLITQSSFNPDSKIWGAGGYIDEELNVRMDGYDQKLQSFNSAIFDCDYIPGCSIFFDTQITNQNFSYIPEIYFLYFEETEWCKRFKDKKLNLKIIPSSLVEHSGEPEKMQAPFRVYFYNRNSILFKLRNFAELKPKLKLIQKTLSEIPNLIWLVIKEKNPEMKLTFKAHLLAKVDAIRLFIFTNVDRASSLSRKRLSYFKVF